MDIGILGLFLLMATLISYTVHLTGFLGGKRTKSSFD